MVVCPSCASPSEDNSAFCEECGSALAVPCPSCGTPATPGKRFCRNCGTALTTADQRPAPPATNAPAGQSTSLPVAERRVCSVLFCDLVGFTPLSESRDPEEVRELLSQYFEAAQTVIERYGGVVEKFIGDAVMAVWGTPTATEEDAERAVRAGLDLVDAVAELGRKRGLPSLAARAGLVTGPVAVTLGATGQGMVAGDAVNTAARVQAVATPGAVLVDEGTWRAARAAIDFSSAGAHALKGKTQPVELWQAGRVLSGVGGAQRIDGLEAGFVGRDAELRLVKELFHACAQRRSPRLVSVTGPAGVGKSRLGWEFEKYIDGLADTVYWHRGRCLSYGEGVAFWALAEMVRQRFGIAEEDSSPVRTEKLAAGLRRWLTEPSEREYISPRLAQLLGTETDAGTPHLAQEELFAGWRLFFERLAEVAPVVMVVEDLQYADAGLLDYLEHLLDWAQDVPIFVLTLARSELESKRAGWATGRRNGTTLTLEPLDATALDALLEGLVPGMPAAAKATVGGRAEGIPLYAVETVRMLIDRDVVQPIDGVYRLVADVGELAVPATLQSLLAARFDALDPDARKLVADAAVLGGSFPAEALIAISEQPEPVVRLLLAELVRREVLGVRADPLSPQRGHYGFVQTMFRQVAYDTLSRRERKARHLAVAAHLQTTFADAGEEVAEVIATHLLDALAAVPDDSDVPTLRTQAVDMLTRAAERAERTGAPVAAAALYANAAFLLEQVDTVDSELAATLLQRAGANSNSAGDLDAALDQYRRAVAAYGRSGDLRAAAGAETEVGAVLRRLGRLDDARVAVSSALAALADQPGEDTVSALAELATLEAFTGNASKADQLSAAALSEGQALDVSDHVIAELLTIRGIAHALADRPAQAAANLREAVRRAEASQNSATAAKALLNLGDAVLTIDADAALAAARAAMAHSRRIGARYAMGFIAGNLIQALLLTGDWSAAEQVYLSGVTHDGLQDDRPLAASAALLRAFSGDPGLAEVLPWADSAGSEDPQDTAGSATALAAAAYVAGRYAEALSQAQVALAHGDALSVRSEAVRWAWPLAADAALTLGNEAEVERLLHWLDAHRPGHLPPVLRAERQRVHARLLAHRGDSTAVSAFETATSGFRQLGSPYHLAVGLLDHAQHLADDGDMAAAAVLAAEAGTIAEGLGARPLLERSDRLAPAAAREAFSHR